MVGFESYYEVSDQGRVRSLDRVVVEKGGKERFKQGRLLRPHLTRTGHLTVMLAGDGTKARSGVHQLVAQAFIGPRPDGMEVRHLDGRPENNGVSNLAWGSRKENQHDRWAHGTDNRGERHGLSKLTEADIGVIRAERLAGTSAAALAERYGVSHATISRASTGSGWSHIDQAVVDVKPRQEVTEATVRMIRQQARAGVRQAEIVRQCGLNQAAVSRIIARKTWAHVSDEVTP